MYDENIKTYDTRRRKQFWRSEDESIYNQNEWKTKIKTKTVNVNRVQNKWYFVKSLEFETRLCTRTFIYIKIRWNFGMFTQTAFTTKEKKRKKNNEFFFFLNWNTINRNNSIERLDFFICLGLSFGVILRLNETHSLILCVEKLFFVMEFLFLFFNSQLISFLLFSTLIDRDHYNHCKLLVVLLPFFLPAKRKSLILVCHINNNRRNTSFPPQWITLSTFYQNKWKINLITDQG